MRIDDNSCPILDRDIYELNRAYKAYTILSFEADFLYHFIRPPTSSPKFAILLAYTTLCHKSPH